MKTLPLFASLLMLLGGTSIPVAAECSFQLSPVPVTQNNSTITGRVVDAVTGKHLVFASISLINSSISNVTNSEGTFTLKIPLSRQTSSDSVLVSYMGYKSTKVATADFKEGKSLRISLLPSAFSIEALHIYPNDPDAIFDMVFSRNNILRNFPSEPEGMQGFYREIIKKGRKFGSVTEAVLDISKASYKGLQSRDNVAISLGRASHNFSMKDTVIMSLQGGPLSNLSLDIASDPFVGTTLDAAHKYYNFFFGDPVELDGKSILVIHFAQKDTSEILYSGDLYIDKATLALVKATFSMNVDYSKYSWREFVKHLPSDVSVKADRADFTVNYKVVGDKLRFDYSHIELDFSVKYADKWLRSKYSVVSELAITEYNNPKALKIPQGQRLRMKDELGTKVKDFSNPDFWGEYNIIEPDASLQSVLKKVVRQLRRQEND